jgi:hypothetical protein
LSFRKEQRVYHLNGSSFGKVASHQGESVAFSFSASRGRVVRAGMFGAEPYPPFTKGMIGPAPSVFLKDFQ